MAKRSAGAGETPGRGRPKSGSPATPASQPGATFPIVGIGMSAGGLESATEFLNAMPADSGMAFVIVQHLEPTRESMLTELLARETAMPVVQIEDGMRVEPDRVHVIVPAKTLIIKDGVLRLTDPQEPRGQRHPIDKFFTALAEDRQEKAIAIILSGAGSNGTAGLQDIKQAGGMGIAQDPLSAKFDSMPRHAIASGGIDFVLAPEKMPDVLRRYVAHSYVEAQQPEIIAKRVDAELGDVLALLHARAGHDFRQYKRNTLARRTHRRMSLAGIERLDSYLAVLRQDPAEVAALAKDMMINVTAFFRDGEAWETLDREVVTPLVDAAERGQSVRVWVPACSTGEEAFTIAMLLAEHDEESRKSLNIKIFATDLAEFNLGAARKGAFPASMVESLSAERLARFFDKGDDDYYRIKRQIRDTVMFAPQNLLQDPPYSRMDLVSCRNFLIYLEPPAQDKVLSLAHFALREGGYLFLGNAETVGQRGHQFTTVSKRWRIYRRDGGARVAPSDFAAWPTQERTAQQPAGPKLAEIAIKSLAERFAPASVLIDGNYHVLHFHGETNDYLAQPAGAPTSDLLTLARPGLRMVIRRAVQKALAAGQPVTAQAGGARAKKGSALSVTVSPTDGGLLLVSFVRENGPPRPASPRAAVEPETDQAERDSEMELKAAREELQGAVEQFETTNEELKAANEEITSVNEELQSTNEELESSKEELQSLNEELTTVNSQLERKITEVVRAGDDIRNLLRGNDVGTIFLDTQMRIKWFTPAVRPLFDLVEGDIGRPIAHFAQRFANVDLLGKAKAAVEKLVTFDLEVSADNGRTYQLRVLPYWTVDNRVEGAAATFIDVSDLKATQEATAEARDYAEAIVETIRDPLIVLNGDLTVRSANSAFCKLFDLREAELKGQLIYEMGGAQWNIPRLRALLEDMLPSNHQIVDFEVELELPHVGSRSMEINARRIEKAADRPERILLAMEDITQRKSVARHQESLIGELSHRVKNTLAVVQSIAMQTQRRSDSLETFGVAFEGRLLALGRAHDSIIEGNWAGIGLGIVVDQAMKPFQSVGHVTSAGGPNIELRPQASLAVAMILHELATNAAKYGALSGEFGQVAISWRLENDDPIVHVALDWTESGGPLVKAPTRRGNGTSFVERSAAFELGGAANIEFAREGLRAFLRFPLARVSMAAHRPGGHRQEPI